MSASKICEGCGEAFYRSKGTRTRDWLVKRFCKPGCRVASGAASIVPERHGATVLGSAMLRDRILDMFVRTANRHHVTLEEAARMHLCPPRAA